MIRNRFIEEDFSFPDEFEDRISLDEFNSMINSLNENVLYSIHKERSVVCGRFNRTGFGLMITLFGILIAFTSLATIGIKKNGVGFLFLWSTVCLGMMTSIVGLAVIVFPDNPKKWKEKALLWASIENIKFGERGIMFYVDTENLEIMPSISIEIKQAPTKVYEFLSGNLIYSIPSYIPPKTTMQESIP